MPVEFVFASSSGFVWKYRLDEHRNTTSSWMAGHYRRGSGTGMMRVGSFVTLRVSKFVALRISAITACVGLGSLIALGGCSTVQVKLGWRVSLAKIPVTSMEASQYKHPGIGPGEKSSLVATFTEPNGTVLATEGKGKGKVLWSDLSVTATVVSVSKKGVLTLPRDPRVSDGKTGHVAITVPSQPSLHAELDIPLRYNYSFASAFSGSSGSSGLNGTDGIDGSSGLPGSIDLDNPSPGGNGSSGTNGTNGGDGGAGGDGPAVQVRVALRPGSQPLLQVGVSSAGHKERFYLVDPQGGSLTVSSDGGSGGSGGKGGRGGRGGSGGIGTPNGSNGSDGSSGSDGSTGSSGNGGSIAVTYDPQVKPFLAAIRLSNQGGPKPVFNQQAMPPLW
jgi:hypothetical protein